MLKQNNLLLASFNVVILLSRNLEEAKSNQLEGLSCLILRKVIILSVILHLLYE